MPISNYPNGFANGVNVRGLPLLNTYGGSIFWVNSGNGSDGNKGTFDRPFSTIDYAVGKCAANNGDIIMVKPGHTDTVSAADGIAFDVAGVTVIGLGTGTARPTITLDTAATADINISAANVTLHNLVFTANFADVARFLQVTAKHAHVDLCEFNEAGANLNWVDVVAMTGAANTADGFKFTRNKVVGIDTANNSTLNITDDLDGLMFNDNYVSVATSNALAVILCATGKDLTNCEVMLNKVHLAAKAAGDMLIDNDTTANSGIVAYNLVGHVDTAAVILVDCDGVRLFENYTNSTDTTSGALVPAADSIT